MFNDRASAGIRSIDANRSHGLGGLREIRTPVRRTEGVASVAALESSIYFHATDGSSGLSDLSFFDGDRGRFR